MTRSATLRTVLAALMPALAAGGTAGAPAGGNSGGYRGPGRNGIFPETGLMTRWPEGGPALVWRYGNLGHGWSAVTVAGDTVYAVGGGSVGSLFAFDLDGRLLWRRRYGREFSVRYMGCRATPTVSGRRVIVASGLGVIYCMGAGTGRVEWSVDTSERFSNQVPGWGYNITPLVIDGKVILPIRRGRSTMVALDLGTGRTVWANEPSEWAIGDSSPVLFSHGRTRLVVSNLWHALIAVEPDSGKVVWKREGKDKAGTALTPVCGEGYLLADFGRKTVMFRPTPDGKGFAELWQVRRIHSTSQAVILDGKVFAFGRGEMPSADGKDRKRKATAYLCYDAATGKLLKAVACKGAPGSVVAAGGMIYWQEAGPRISLARPTRDGFEIVSSFGPGVGGREVWIHPVIARGRLFVRSDCAQGGDYATESGKLAVYDLRAGREAELHARRARVRSLVAKLKAARPADRAEAAKGLLEMGHHARGAVAALVAALGDEVPTVREAAAAALAAAGPAAIPLLIKLLRTEGRPAGSLAADALVRATAGAKDLAAALIDAAESSPDVRDDAGAVLAKVGDAAAGRLNRLLRSQDRHVRWWALGVLMEYGPGAKVAVGEMIRLAGEDNQWFRAKAARALGGIGPAARDAVPALLKLLKHDWPEARAAAAEGLAGIGDAREAVLSALQAATKDEDDKAARAAVEALKKLRR